MPEISPDLLLQIRERFCHVASCPFTGERIFFENAGGALTLRSVVETSTMLASVPDNQGRDNAASRKLVEMIATGRNDAKLFFNAKSGAIITGESGTELLFRLISAAALSGQAPGRVLGSTLEHPASVSAAQRWSRIAGLEYVAVPHNDATGTVTLDDYLPEITADTRVATIVHTSPVTGMGVDIAAISNTIRDIAPDCMIIVDGIQHAAHGLIDIAAAPIDGYVVSPYKVFSRHGYGLAWMSDRLIDVEHNALIGGPARNWEMGTRDTASYATFSDVVTYLDWLGGEVSDETDPRARIEAAGHAIHSHEKTLTDATLHGTGNLPGLADIDGVTVIGGIDNPAREGLVCFSMQGISAPDIVSRLSENGIRAHVRKPDHYSGNILRPLKMDGCVRISYAHYNSVDEVARLLAVINEIRGTGQM